MKKRAVFRLADLYPTSVYPKRTIDILPAFKTIRHISHTIPVAVERPARAVCISIDLPAAVQQIIPALVVDKAPHVLRGISEKQSDLMWEVTASANAVPKQLQMFFMASAFTIPKSAQHIPHLFLAKPAAERILVVQNN